MTTLEIQGGWNNSKDQLKRKGAGLIDNRLKYRHGRIQKATVETRGAVGQANNASHRGCGCN